MQASVIRNAVKVLADFVLRAEENRWVKVALVLWGLCLASLMVWQSVHHVMWRDELQAFVVARDAHSLADFWTAMGFEGFPALWFGLLKGLQLVTANPVAMQGLHLALALGSLFALARFAPFHPFLKAVVIAAYPFVFQYAVVSRCYAIGIVLIIAALVARDKGKPSLYWLLLGLAGHSTILVMCLSCMLAFERFVTSPRQLWKEKGGVVLFTALVALAVLCAFPHPDRMGVADIIQGEHTPWSFFQMLSIAFMVPWQGQAASGSLLFFGGFLLVAATALGFRLSALAGLVSCLIVFMGVDHFSYPMAAYHLMLVPVGIVFLMWQARTTRQPFAALAAFVLFLFPAMAGVNVLTSVPLIPYSQGRNVAGWIKAEGLQNDFWVTMPDYTATTVAGYAGMQFFSPQCHCLMAAPRWSKKNAAVPPTVSETVDQALAALQGHGQDKGWLLLGHSWSADQDKPTIQAAIGTATLTRAFQGAMIGNEQYLVYRLTLKKEE